MRLRFLLLWGLLHLAVTSLAAVDIFQPEIAEQQKIAAMLSSGPTAFGRPLADRAGWKQAGERLDSAEIQRQAEALLKIPLAEQNEDNFLDYSRTGNRTRYEAVMFRRRSRIKWFVLAEGIENRGRFIPPLEETIHALSAERTWVMPAHDGHLDNFNGRLTAIDLGAAMLSWDLATANWIVGEKFSPETRKLIHTELERRIFKPYHRMTAGEQGQYWLLFTHNWNSVCLAGVTGAALATLDDANERAWFVLAAEKYSQYSLKGFTQDGYCSEGVGYWNYGFGHYTMLSEAIRLATQGGVDLLARPNAKAPAAYGSSIEIINGVCPAFADCPVEAHPNPCLVNFLSARLGTAREGNVNPKTITGARTLYEVLMFAFQAEPPNIAAKATTSHTPALRSWFPDAGVLICRPATNSKSAFGFAALGGNNGENHNHNDVGSYVVVVGNQPVLADIGSEVYTARTFGSHRYDSKALNSFGHPVPLVAGTLQQTGRQAAAKILKTDFANTQDSVTFDIKSAYSVPGLKTLNRSFAYSRKGAASLTITDKFEFAAPETFENALLTFGKWEKLDSHTLRISDRGATVRVEISSPAGSTLDFVAEEIKEDLTAHRTPTRIGLRLSKPLKSGSVTLKISPE